MRSTLELPKDEVTTGLLDGGDEKLEHTSLLRRDITSQGLNA